MEKVYEISSDQIDTIDLLGEDKWVLLHLCYNDNNIRNIMFPSKDSAFKGFINFWEEEMSEEFKSKFPADFEQKLQNHVINNFTEEWLNSLNDYLLREYGWNDFQQKNYIELLKTDALYLALVIVYAAASSEGGNFYFDNFHIAVKSVDKLLAVDFWTKIKQKSIKK